jgi:hypothetical protein
MSDSPTASRWRVLVEAHAACGLPIREFARQRDVNASSLSWWCSRLRQTSAGTPQAPAEAASNFGELTVSAAVPRDRLILTLDRVKVSVVVDQQTDLALLRLVLEALA